MGDSARNVFISHYNRDEEHIGNLKKLIGDKEGVSLRNYSIDSNSPNNATNEEYIKKLLREKIANTGTVVVLIGPKTHTRYWINWEIEIAKKLGKRIVGVYVHGASDSDVPENFENYGDALIGWQADKIIDAIDGFIDNMVTPEGEDRLPKYSGDGTNC
jgi:hypothetical protein